MTNNLELVAYYIERNRNIILLKCLANIGVNEACVPIHTIQKIKIMEQEVTKLTIL